MFNQQIVNDKDIDICRKERLEIYNRLRNLAEGMSCTFLNFNDLMYNQYLINNCNDRIISALLSDLIPPQIFWKELDIKCQLQGKKIWFVTDNLIEQPQHSFKNIYLLSFPKLMGTISQNNIFKVTPKFKRLYNCFIHRCESVRQSWFYFLWLEGLLEKGYVSYLLFQLESYSKLKGVDLFDFIHYNNGLDNLEKFRKAHRELRSKVPYTNFQESFDLTHYINDSKYSVVLETYANNDDRSQWCFTEKILRSLQFPTISLIFSQKHSMKILEDLGFAIDDINKNWDGCDWIDRQRQILEVLKTDSVEYNPVLKKEQAYHNQDLLSSWKKEYHLDDFFDPLIESIKLS